jgi:type I restriction enzyme, S subunit
VNLQHRIVAKVDELMALCDQLEAQQADAIEAHKTLVTTVLDALTKAAEKESFDTAWSRIAEHFDTLFTTEWSVDKLKQTILQLAVMGKLVPHGSDGELASDLVDRIATERTELIAAKKLKKPKAMKSWDDLERPFELPARWKWVRLGDLCYVVADGPHYSPDYVDGSSGVAFLSARNISTTQIDTSTAKFVSRSDHESFCKRVRVKKGDVLYTKGGTTGVAKVNDLDLEFSVWVHIAVLQIPLDMVFNEYLALALNSPHCYEQSQKYTHGTGNKDLGLTRMINITIPFPPLDEQQCVVAEVNRLMAICDQLKLTIREVQQTQLLLADAITEQAVA